jgi:hypothetical protein
MEMTVYGQTLNIPLFSKEGLGEILWIITLSILFLEHIFKANILKSPLAPFARGGKYAGNEPLLMKKSLCP